MPLVSRTFDQLIDFTRTSSATFVGSNGLIQSTPASRNLLTFTQEFDNAAWTKTRCSITANSVAAPDGLMTADTLVEDTTATSTHPVSFAYTFNGSAHTLSIYAKASGRNWLYIGIPGTANAHASFNVATGVVGTVGAAATAAISSAGNGWYRCSITATPAAGANSVAFYPATADNTSSYTGTGIASLYLWGAQLELASTASDYTRNFGGLFPPRFDYDPVTLAPRGLLIEEQRTNLLLRSEEFDTVSWVKVSGGSAVTANSVTSPDGTNDADTITAVAGAGFHYLNQPVAGLTGAYTTSFYVKKGTSTWIFFGVQDSALNYFNLDTGLFGTTPDTCTATAVGNGWYRITATRTLTAATANNGIGLASGDGGANFTATGTETVHVWGAQLEAGAFATSYIPTVASQVTRTADTALIQAPNFAPWYNQSEGTIVAEWALNHANATGRYIVKGSSPTVGAGVGPWVNSNGIDTRAWVGGTSITVGNASLTAPNKVAFGYSPLNNAASLNGASAVANTTATAPADVNLLEIGGSGASQLNGHIRSIRYYPVRLSNAQLQALTA